MVIGTAAGFHNAATVVLSRTVELAVLGSLIAITSDR